MSTVLVVVVVVAVVILDRDANHFNVDDGSDDDDCRNFLRTFIRLFIFSICFLLSLIRRLFVKCAAVELFKSILAGSGFVYRFDHCEN